MTDLVVSASTPAPMMAAELALSAENARTYLAAAVSANTLRAYKGQWTRFVGWCRARGVEPLPAAPESVALYLVDLADAGRKAATIEQALVAISQAHVLAGHPSPRGTAEPRAVRAGIRRTIGTAQEGKAPLLAEGLRTALEASGDRGRAGLRDAALLLVGWHGAFRRSELVALDVEHVRWLAQGLEVTIARSKTDQEGRGRIIPIPRGATEELCPDRVLRAWLAEARITTGALFRSVDQWGNVGGRLSAASVARIVKRAAALAGLPVDAFAGHSLRSGLVTDAALSGRTEPAIMRITGHTSVMMVRRYIRAAQTWTDVASGGLLEAPASP